MKRNRFSDEANIHYRLGSIEDLTKETLERIIQHHYNEQRPRLKVLEGYFKGENVNILTGKRRKEEHLADNRATHNFARYVSKFIKGYLVGSPVQTDYTDVVIAEMITAINSSYDEEATDSYIAIYMS